MTSPENAEPPTATGDKATPPWQRLSKESGNGTADGPTQWLPTGGRPPEPAPSSGSPAPEQPVVSGTAAGGLFGSPDALAGLQGQETLTVPTTPAKGRGTPSALRRPGRGPRRASLQVKRFDPWSVLKLSLVLGVAMFFVWLVAVGVLYTVLDGMGVWDKLNGTYSSLVSGEGANAPADPLISAGRVFGIAAILGAINIVLLSALATVSAFIYNVSADLAGGLEVTLSERE